jgi:hypothetical protein
MPRIRTPMVSYRYTELRTIQDPTEAAEPGARGLRLFSGSAGSIRSARTIVALIALAGAGTLARTAWRASLAGGQGLPDGLRPRLPQAAGPFLGRLLGLSRTEGERCLRPVPAEFGSSPRRYRRCRRTDEIAVNARGRRRRSRPRPSSPGLSVGIGIEKECRQR